MNIITVGMDLGDKKNAVCVLDTKGTILMNIMIANNKKELRNFIVKLKSKNITVALETGTQSPWISRFLESLGCKVLIGNARKLRMIWKSDRKSDKKDAEMLARIARLDPELLNPIKHRSEKCHADLTLVKSRELVLGCRKQMINNIRSMIKVFGSRLPSCSADTFYKKVRLLIPEALKAALFPLLDLIEELTLKLKKFDKDIAKLCIEKYPETNNIRQIVGVGPITSLAFVLTLETPDKFQKSRDVGSFLGMVPRRDQSGVCDKQLPITKSGNKYMRQLLVNCAHYILGPFGKDCNLRRFGEKLMIRGGKNAKKRTIIAVARKLAVLMHRLWKTGDEYEPLYNIKNKEIKLIA